MILKYKQLGKNSDDLQGFNRGLKRIIQTASTLHTVNRRILFMSDLKGTQLLCVTVLLHTESYCMTALSNHSDTSVLRGGGRRLQDGGL